MLCVRWNCSIVQEHDGILYCSECGKQEVITLPTFFYFHDFVELAYGEDFFYS